ncbi:hypothetical protein Naga_102461g1 [Nannochloropsis gaditana]|uniref:Uncharacterized protein n=1 Tax=Nannochloropsis gaditana TaxID=72520 RepID=W7TGB7_9STRA|nr:hypothetical protein Naga_102461g1 [Nannochloropsis gaditana]
MVLASVAGIAVVGVLCMCLPCMIIIKQACSCPPSPFGLALWQARGTRFATNLWAAWKPTSNSVSFPFPPSHLYTTTTCTACLLALLLAAIINHDHQGDKMLRRFTAKAGAMARRGSTLPGPGEVACVMHFGRTRAC